MKKCIFCGQENDDKNKFCIKCGYKFENEDTSPKNNEEETTEKVDVLSPINNKNSLANVALILGIISGGCLFVPIGLPFAVVISLFAITTGIVSLIRKPKIEKTKAILGIVIGAVALLLSIIIFIVAGPVIEILKEYIQSYCKSNPGSEECLMLEQQLPGFFK